MNNIVSNCQKRVLANGLTAIFCYRPQAPLFSACITSRVGSVNEGPGLTGVSHFLEHLMFKGTELLGTLDYSAEVPLLQQIDSLAQERLQEQAKLRTCYAGGQKECVERLTSQISSLEAELKPLSVPNEMWTIYQRHGGVGLNAGTGCDGTRYYVTLPKNKLELWAFLEADRLRTPVFREFYAEREVVQEERRLRVDNDPDGTLYEQVNALLNLGSPYEAPIVGWPRDLQTLTREAVQRYFAEYYAPANLVVCLVGDLDEQEVWCTLERYFSDIPARSAPPLRFADRGVQIGERRVVIPYAASPHLLIGYPGPKPGHDDQYALDVACEILSGSRNSRFYRNLVESGLAYYASIDQRSRAWDNALLLNLYPQAEHTSAELEKAAYREISGLVNDGPTEMEMERVYTRLRVDWLESLRSPADLASSLAEAEAFRGGWEQFDDLDRYMAVTASDIPRVLRQYLQDGQRSVGEIVTKVENQSGNIG
ncbi:MAG: pitrilysin family protein [bacterium]|nr:pitrilysin family protein [bacterium]